MFDRAQIKLAAKGQIKGNIGILFVCIIIMGFLGSITLGLAAPAMGISSILIYLALINSQKPSVGNSTAGFSFFGKALWLAIITGFFTMLWSSLFCIPGIIKSYSYSLAPYILAENPTMTAREALNESKRITTGAKKDLFVMDLSFLGWMMLGGITFGIALIYVYPYMQATKANAYLAIKAKNDATTVN